MKKLIIFLAILFSNLIYSQTDYFSEGMLGRNKIYLHISEWDDNKISATYFYQNSLKDILLEGTKEKEKFILAFKNANTDGIYEQFELTKLTNNIFKGFWTNSSGKKIPLKLNPIHFSDYKPNSIVDKNNNKLDLIKLNFIAFIKDSTSTYKEKKIDWYSEKHCKVPFFRLGDNFSELEKSKINAQLEKIHCEDVISQLNCSTRFEYSTGEGIEQTVRIGYLSANLLGFEVSSGWYCGGAHPDFGSQGYLIDLSNGKSFEIGEIIAFDKSVTLDKATNFSAYTKYRETYFAPGIYTLINETEHFKKPTSDQNENDEENCDYTNLDFWQFVSWNFTESGIEFTPHFYRFERNRDQPFLVSFSSLLRYKNTSFPYKL